ncbi:MAG: glycosyltransferase family 39 protein [Flavobacteriales bacterium]|nr:glycosyltransferase family 39 protein [Flavobacteriales bacterium]MCX7767649.1 glycosyltransferase family 39 protein [Flavobacteriales bacterium]MDW8409509.1 glycosyltransferase family 39 protein [Flavobacteriales bacterium]
MKFRAVPQWILAAVWALVLWLPGLGAVPLFDWDEINFAEVSREMVISGQYLQPTINFQPFWEKPPLFFWLQALSYHLWGINECAARLPNVFCGLVTLGWMARAIPGPGSLWAMLYAGSLLPHLYFRSGIIDPWYNLFGFWMLWYGLKALDAGHIRHFIVAGLCGGLALATKGPAVPGLVSITLGIYSLRYRCWRKSYPVAWIAGISIFCAVGLIWYILYGLKYGPQLLQDFLSYQIRLLSTSDAGHTGFPGFHGAVLFVGLMPASAFFLGAIPQGLRRDYWPHLLLVILVVGAFSIVKTKIVHYSSLAYFPITWMAALWLWERRNARIPAGPRIVAAFQWLFLALGLAVSILFLLKPQNFLPHIQDELVRANILHASPALRWPAVVALFTASAASFSLLGAHSFKRLQRALILTTLTITLAIYGVVPTVERISQGPVIDACLKAKHHGLPVYTSNFKSYAPYFYGAVMPPGWPHPPQSGSYALIFRRDKPFHIPSDCPCDTLGGYLVCLKLFNN